MTRRNGRRNVIHTNRLLPSDKDTIALGASVEGGFLDLCGSWKRIRFEEIPIPQSLDRDLYLWRQMRVRHQKHDFRNSEAELKATKTIAEWSVARNCELRNQPPHIIQWRD